MKSDIRIEEQCQDYAMRFHQRYSFCVETALWREVALRAR
jgi:hypothetical protein